MNAPRPKTTSPSATDPQPNTVVSARLSWPAIALRAADGGVVASGEETVGVAGSTPSHRTDRRPLRSGRETGSAAAQVVEELAALLRREFREFAREVDALALHPPPEPREFVLGLVEVRDRLARAGQVVQLAAFDGFADAAFDDRVEETHARILASE